MPADSPAVRHPAELKLRGYNTLVVRNANGKNPKLAPNQVASFILGSKHYIALRGVNLPGPKEVFSNTAIVHEAFVQQVDSGRVVLYYYQYQQGQGMNGSYPVEYYLLRHADSPTLTLVVGNDKKFRELMRPYLAGRPDLLKYLDDNRLANVMLPDLIHAVNTGATYHPPRKYPLPTY